MITLTEYGALADEYYNASAHPTCANFRRISLDFIAARISSAPTAFSTCLEIGAGRSVLAELRAGGVLNCDRLVVTDLHPEMLAHSDAMSAVVDQTLALDICDPTQTKGFAAKADLAVASLADPYDDASFWSGLSDVVAPGGDVIVTTPSLEWVRAFRAGEPGDEMSAARFETAAGRVWVRSMVRSVEEEVALMRAHGFEPLTSAKLYRPRSGFSPAAPKLDPWAAQGLPLCVGYHAYRAATVA
ncbi:MAG: hypothetical protein QNJ16_15505 [Rhodobacter sp.]|nr:hypothetical protein [Rhodobacter sp.]